MQMQNDNQLPAKAMLKTWTDIYATEKDKTAK